MKLYRTTMAWERSGTKHCINIHAIQSQNTVFSTSKQEVINEIKNIWSKPKNIFVLHEITRCIVFSADNTNRNLALITYNYCKLYEVYSCISRSLVWSVAKSKWMWEIEQNPLYLILLSTVLTVYYKFLIIYALAAEVIIWVVVFWAYKSSRLQCGSSQCQSITGCAAKIAISSSSPTRPVHTSTRKSVCSRCVFILSSKQESPKSL